MLIWVEIDGFRQDRGRPASDRGPRKQSEREPTQISRRVPASVDPPNFWTSLDDGLSYFGAGHN